MHMISVRADLEKLELIAGLKLQAHFPQHLINQAIDYHPPILGREHQVVEQHRDVVTLVDISAHPQPSRRKRRGMQPKAIQGAHVRDCQLGRHGRLSFPPEAPMLSTIAAAIFCLVLGLLMAASDTRG